MTIPWDDLRLSHVEDVARHCDDACRADVISLVAEVRRLRASAAAARISELEASAEHARASALLLNSGHDDHALQDRILDLLGDILGPLPGDAAD